MTQRRTQIETIPGLLQRARGESDKQDMAGAFDTTPASYGRWERGEVPLPVDRLTRLAELTGTPIEELQRLWKLDSGERAMRRAARKFDLDGSNSPSDLAGTLSMLVEQQGRVLELLTELLDRYPPPERP